MLGASLVLYTVIPVLGLATRIGLMTPSPPKEVQITLRIPGELARLLDDQAEATRTNRSWVIRDALHKYFESKSSDEVSGESPAPIE